MNLAALRINARHDVLDGAVLPGRIHRLENEQDRPFILGIELVLQFGQGEHAGGKRFLRPRLVFFLRKLECVIRIDILEAKILAFRDAELARDAARILD